MLITCTYLSLSRYAKIFKLYNLLRSSAETPPSPRNDFKGSDLAVLDSRIIFKGFIDRANRESFYLSTSSNPFSLY